MKRKSNTMRAIIINVKRDDFKPIEEPNFVDCLNPEFIKEGKLILEEDIVKQSNSTIQNENNIKENPVSEGEQDNSDENQSIIEENEGEDKLSKVALCIDTLKEDICGYKNTITEADAVDTSVEYISVLFVTNHISAKFIDLFNIITENNDTDTRNYSYESFKDLVGFIVKEGSNKYCKIAMCKMVADMLEYKGVIDTEEAKLVLDAVSYFCDTFTRPSYT